MQSIASIINLLVSHKETNMRDLYEQGMLSDILPPRNPRFRESEGTLNLIRLSRPSDCPSVCHKNFNLVKT